MADLFEDTPVLAAHPWVSVQTILILGSVIAQPTQIVISNAVL